MTEDYLDKTCTKCGDDACCCADVCTYCGDWRDLCSCREDALDMMAEMEDHND